MNKTCHFPKCTEAATIRCSGCQHGQWCSADHQVQDWTDEQHPRICGLLQIGDMTGHPDLVDQFALNRIAPQSLTLDLIDEYYHNLKYLARGDSGVVFEATAKKATTLPPLVLKFIMNKADRYGRELYVSRLLTRLYVNSGLDTTMIVPIVKSYDAATGNAPVAKLSQWIRKNGVTDPPHFLRGPFSDPISDKMEFSVIVMEKVTGNFFTTFIEPLFLPENNYSIDAIEQQIMQAFLQVLLVLHSLETSIKFVHMDLDIGNLMLQTFTEPVVLHTTVSSNVSYNIRTTYILKLGDFEWSRLQYDGPGGKRVTGPGSIYHPVSDNVPDYVPWFDLSLFALNFLYHIPNAYFARLIGRPKFWDLLVHMIHGTAPAGSDAERLLHEVILQIRKFMHPGSIDITALDLFKGKCLRLSSLVFEEPTKGKTAGSVLQNAAHLFPDAQTYIPTADDKVYDLTLKVGDQSPATHAAWRALFSVDAAKFAPGQPPPEKQAVRRRVAK